MMNISSENDELSLISQAADGNQVAFCTLVIAYESSILTYLSAFLDNWENARDVAQETFVAAYYALPRWMPPEKLLKENLSGAEPQDYVDLHPLAPWLYRIATNKALTFLKKQEHYQQAIAQKAEAVATDTAVEDIYIAREHLQNLLKRLSAEDAMCIILRFVMDERYTEIAERLHLSKEAVRKRIYRGLNTLRSMYETLEIEEEIV